MKNEFGHGSSHHESSTVHRNTDLRSRTKAFAISIIKFYSSLKKSTEIQIIGKQMLRSGTSIGANYREACRSRSRAEFISKLGICIQEADETQYWLECMEEGCQHTEPILKSMWKECDELIRILTASSRKAKSVLKEDPITY